MSLQRAFTFTELLIVVAVLAMLAAAAVPRFAAINKDIRAGAVEALATNVQSSAHLTNRIWLSNGRPARLTVDGRMLEMRFGYPTESSIREVVVTSGDFLFKVGYWQHRELLSAPGCAVLYIPPPNPESEPVVISYTDGC
ncbi:MAG: prepilin-type N-terminal cleavage/methylation domain-containing protein [Gammaproteobacteria bacterium]|nr:MAG: prepilin-type N-terminal cleavage/methylation domain-containing protein [Gammaproteobacteria bacterium]